MQTKVSTKGQVVLPHALRRQLDIRAGDNLYAEVKNGRIVLTPRNHRQHRVQFITDPVTGFPALSAGPEAPPLTSKEVTEILRTTP
jgi:AbrB family looped-hinge helix DNA binding protein